jgi:DNA-binding transcriptional LysR family regulator
MFRHAAEELHFGHAAQKLNMLPSAFGRFIRLLEEDLDTKLFVRTTRNVVLTEAGNRLLGEARKLLAQADTLRANFRDHVQVGARKLRVGAIDIAAVGLMPLLLTDFRKEHPDVEVQLLEEKAIRLLPRIPVGWISPVATCADLAITKFYGRRTGLTSELRTGVIPDEHAPRTARLKC